MWLLHVCRAAPAPAASAPPGFEKEGRFMFKTDMPEPLALYTGDKVCASVYL